MRKSILSVVLMSFLLSGCLTLAGPKIATFQRQDRALSCDSLDGEIKALQVRAADLDTKVIPQAAKIVALVALTMVGVPPLFIDLAADDSEVHAIEKRVEWLNTVYIRKGCDDSLPPALIAQIALTAKLRAEAQVDETVVTPAELAAAAEPSGVEVLTATWLPQQDTRAPFRTKSNPNLDRFSSPPLNF